MCVWVWVYCNPYCAPTYNVLCLRLNIQLSKLAGYGQMKVFNPPYTWMQYRYGRFMTVFGSSHRVCDSRMPKQQRQVARPNNGSDICAIIISLCFNSIGVLIVDGFDPSAPLPPHPHPPDHLPLPANLLHPLFVYCLLGRKCLLIFKIPKWH